VERSLDCCKNGIKTAMAKPTGHNDPCPCGSGKKYKKCCGTPKGEVVQVRVKDLRDLEWTPGLAEALVNSLDPAYIEYFTAASSGASREKAEKAIAAVSEDKRYLTRVSSKRKRRRRTSVALSGSMEASPAYSRFPVLSIPGTLAGHTGSGICFSYPGPV